MCSCRAGFSHVGDLGAYRESGFDANQMMRSHIGWRFVVGEAPIAIEEGGGEEARRRHGAGRGHQDVTAPAAEQRCRGVVRLPCPGACSPWLNALGGAEFCLLGFAQVRRFCGQCPWLSVRWAAYMPVGTDI
jgi:hypothetical protein